MKETFFKTFTLKDGRTALAICWVHPQVNLPTVTWFVSPNGCDVCTMNEVFDQEWGLHKGCQEYFDRCDQETAEQVARALSRVVDTLSQSEEGRDVLDNTHILDLTGI